MEATIKLNNCVVTTNDPHSGALQHENCELSISSKTGYANSITIGTDITVTDDYVVNVSINVKDDFEIDKILRWAEALKKEREVYKAEIAKAEKAMQ